MEGWFALLNNAKDSIKQRDSTKKLFEHYSKKLAKLKLTKENKIRQDPLFCEKQKDTERLLRNERKLETSKGNYLVSSQTCFSSCSAVVNSKYSYMNPVMVTFTRFLLRYFKTLSTSFSPMGELEDFIKNLEEKSQTNADNSDSQSKCSEFPTNISNCSVLPGNPFPTSQKEFSKGDVINNQGGLYNNQKDQKTLNQGNYPTGFSYPTNNSTLATQGFNSQQRKMNERETNSNVNSQNSNTNSQAFNQASQAQFQQQSYSMPSMNTKNTQNMASNMNSNPFQSLFAFNKGVPEYKDNQNAQNHNSFNDFFNNQNSKPECQKAINNAQNNSNQNYNYSDHSSNQIFNNENYTTKICQDMNQIKNCQVSTNQNQGKGNKDGKNSGNPFSNKQIMNTVSQVVQNSGINPMTMVSTISQASNLMNNLNFKQKDKESNSIDSFAELFTNEKSTNFLSKIVNVVKDSNLLDFAQNKKGNNKPQK